MKTARDDWKNELREAIRQAGLTRAEAAEAVRVSVHTLEAWLKPMTSRSANPAPLWAVELICLKYSLPMPEVCDLTDS